MVLFQNQRVMKFDFIQGTPDNAEKQTQTAKHAPAQGLPNLNSGRLCADTRTKADPRGGLLSVGGLLVLGATPLALPLGLFLPLPLGDPTKALLGTLLNSSRQGRTLKNPTECHHTGKLELLAVRWLVPCQKRQWVNYGNLGKGDRLGFSISLEAILDSGPWRVLPLN